MQKFALTDRNFTSKGVSLDSLNSLITYSEFSEEGCPQIFQNFPQNHCEKQGYQQKNENAIHLLTKHNMSHKNSQLGALIYTKSGRVRSSMTLRIYWKKNFQGKDEPFTIRGDRFNENGSPTADQQLLYLLKYIDKHFLQMKKFQLYDNRKPEGQDLLLMVEDDELLAFNFQDEWAAHAIRVIGAKLRLLKSISKN